MGKKQTKTKTITRSYRRSNAEISFNTTSVKFGNTTFILDGLKKQFINLFIFLYKYRKFPPHFYHKKDEPQRKICITPLEASALIFSGISNKSIFQLNLAQLSEKVHKIEVSKQLIEEVPISSIQDHSLKEKMINLLKLATQLMSQIRYDLKQCQLVNKSEVKHQKLMNYYRKVILEKERQLFQETIVMVIELRQPARLFDVEYCQKSIVIFEQCYPQKIYEKNSLIDIIGVQKYQQKVLNFYSYAKKHFQNKISNNSNFSVCHQCMEPISSNHQSQIIKCNRIIQKGSIEPEVYTDPNLYYQRLLKLNFNQQNQNQLYFGFYHYYRAMADHVVQFKCNRYLCLECSLAKRLKKIDLCICEFCSGTCQCRKCTNYYSLVKMLANYRNLGGDIKQVSQSFVFQYSEDQKRKAYIRYHHEQQFRYINQMKGFYNELTQIKKHMEVKNLQQQKVLPNRGNQGVKKTFDQISFYKKQHFQQKLTKRTDYLNQKQENNNKRQIDPFRKLKHKDTKSFSQRAIYLIPQRQKKKMLIQKKKNKMLLDKNKGQSIFKHLTNEQFKQTIDKDLKILQNKLQKKKILLKQIPKQNVKESKNFAVRPKTKAEQQTDSFYECKLKYVDLPIAENLFLTKNAQKLQIQKRQIVLENPILAYKQNIFDQKSIAQEQSQIQSYQERQQSEQIEVLPSKVNSIVNESVAEQIIKMSEENNGNAEGQAEVKIQARPCTQVQFVVISSQEDQKW